MNFNKNKIESILLLISAGALMATMLELFIGEKNFLFYTSDFVLELAIVLVSITFSMYAFLIIRRINPRKYIYISYTMKNHDLAKEVALSLNEQLNKSSKYRFEILTADSIPYGSDMQETMFDNIRKSEIVIIVISPDYIQNEWCKKEFSIISESGKKIIPIITDSFHDLSLLPKDLSNIKALSLRNCASGKELNRKMSILAKDLIKRRID